MDFFLIGKKRRLAKDIVRRRKIIILKKSSNDIVLGQIGLSAMYGTLI